MLLASLNPSLAHVRGIRVHLLEYVFVLLVTILTVACVKIIGAVLVEALLLIPAAAARNLNRSIRGFVWWSIIFSTISLPGGCLCPAALRPAGAFRRRHHPDRAAAIFLVTMLIRMTVPRLPGGLPVNILRSTFALLVMCVAMAPVRAADANGPLVLTGIQATYSLATALTAGTGIRVQNVPADGREMSMQKGTTARGARRWASSSLRQRR